MDNSAHLETSETERWAIEYVPETGSTQTDLAERAERGVLRHRTALRTDFQRTGRGRLDRAWGAPPGTNLLVSLGFVEVPADPGALMRRVGVAAVDAVASFIGPATTADTRTADTRTGENRTGENTIGSADIGATAAPVVGLKWPNDLLIDGRKAAGMLAQRCASGAVIVGLGLNVGWAPEGAASVAAYREPPGPTPDEVLAELLARFDALGDPTVLALRYRSNLVTLGERVRVELPTETIEGTATDIGPVGELVVRTVAGDVRTLMIGDVKHLRTLAPEDR